ncbi:MAG: type VI secretion system ATPase TssH [Polyangiaceae bacterium]
MIAVELKPLLGRLNAVSLHAVEAAASACVSRGHYEITVEHVLLELLQTADCDVPRVLAHFDVSVPHWLRSLVETIESVRTGNAGKPVLAPSLVEWIEDSWMVASIDQGASAVRSGTMLLALVPRARRLMSSDLPELEKISAERLKQDFASIVAGSLEDDRPAPSHQQPSARARAGDALSKYATNLTAAAREGKIDPVFGRDREIRQMVDILARRRKNNPIVVGEAGVGKTAIVEGLALRIAQGDVPELLASIDIWGLDLGLLQAGAGVKGEFENRLKGVLEEVKRSAGSIILFIDEAHTLIGAGSAPGSADAANLLKPALARGEVRTIAATTWGEYKKYFEEDAALARRFQPVTVGEPSVSETAIMLRGLKSKYEAAHGVEVRDDAIDVIAQLSARYISGRLLPDKAVDVLDTAAARVRVAQSAKPASVEDVERRIQALERERAGTERDRAGGAAIDPERLGAIDRSLGEARRELDALTARWQEQRAALERVRTERGKTPLDAAALASALEELKRVQGASPLVRLEVDPEVVAQVVGDWTGVPVGRMLRDEVKQIALLEERLRERIKGQDNAVAVVGRALRNAKAGLKDPKKPLVFLLVGPSGVGKTELGLTVADTLFGGERFVVTINMSEYQDREMGVSGLVGAKPGYVGYGKGGTLTEAVRQRPYSVVLLDEIEKACQEVRNLFYQVFDKGELTDGTGRKIDFKNTVIFMTTNLAAELIQRFDRGAGDPDPADVLSAVRPTLSRALQPAWLARTTVVPMLSLTDAALLDITKLKLQRIQRQLAETQSIELVWAAELERSVAQRCHDAETGARNIDYILEEALLPRLADTLLQAMGDAERPRVVRVDVDAAGRFSAVVTERAPSRGSAAAAERVSIATEPT